ncbi:hypothetical protein ACCO45_004844 [Purpureocillium lilacinum]|uniref:Uncharacterized protein n=1 Tax=Purpureocillium lilacinum TaxID=33203 RepID=A0ACC4DUF1_PURLI
MPTATFNVPPQYRRFTLFSNLPPEIRLRVWEEYLESPGVSFVKVEPSETTWRARFLPPLSFVDDDDDQDHRQLHLDEVSLAIKRESLTKPPLPARLVACYPVRVADISNYNTLHADLITMSRTCSESSSLARQLASREGALRLDNGVLVALEGSQDLITLDYLPPTCTRLTVPWKSIFLAPASKRSDGPPYVSRLCGSQPKHILPSFLARHLPNLEEFYLMDYFVVEKSDSEKATWDIIYGDGRGENKNPCPGPQRQRTFRAKDRVFHEIVGDGSSDRAWKTDSKTGRIRDWLRDSFVRYCNNSPLARHQSPNKVRFGILACQFNILPPSPSKAKTYPSSGKLRPVRERPTRAKASQAGKLFGSSSRSAASLFGELGTGHGRLFGDDVSAAWITRLQNEMASRPAPIPVNAPPQPPRETDQAQSWGAFSLRLGVSVGFPFASRFRCSTTRSGDGLAF